MEAARLAKQAKKEVQASASEDEEVETKETE